VGGEEGGEEGGEVYGVDFDVRNLDAHWSGSASKTPALAWLAKFALRSHAPALLQPAIICHPSSPGDDSRWNEIPEKSLECLLQDTMYSVTQVPG